MDGAYIPDTAIVENECKIHYEKDVINTNDVKRIMIRNQQKRENLNRLIHLPKVWNSIPYSVYFFSCNLDDVLHGEANLKMEDKNKLAKQFESDYMDNPSKFIEFFNQKEIVVHGEYEESWKFISFQTNSLQRYSNFAIYLNKCKKN
ncbi:hypothetical protein [Tannockella kyphosi]|uniref:hypothetical protein n=1 Tax=Tannockella kyphosi TaxID=2899121 RepID=UPI0020114DED|nr:hypothetical protein [Tannockella kyphosi]